MARINSVWCKGRRKRRVRGLFYFYGSRFMPYPYNANSMKREDGKPTKIGEYACWLIKRETAMRQLGVSLFLVIATNPLFAQTRSDSVLPKAVQLLEYCTATTNILKSPAEVLGFDPGLYGLNPDTAPKGLGLGPMLPMQEIVIGLAKQRILVTAANPTNSICEGYFLGFVSAIRLSSSLLVCNSRFVSTDEVIRIFLKYMGDHPQNLSEQADLMVLRSLADAFPCNVAARPHRTIAVLIDMMTTGKTGQHETYGSERRILQMDVEKYLSEGGFNIATVDEHTRYLHIHLDLSRAEDEKEEFLSYYTEIHYKDPTCQFEDLGDYRFYVGLANATTPDFQGIRAAVKILIDRFLSEFAANSAEMTKEIATCRRR